MQYGQPAYLVCPNHIGMDKIILHRLVAALDDEEVKKAKRFLASPYHTTDPLLERYFAQLCKYRPNMDDHRLSSEVVYRALFPKEAYHEKKMRNLRYKLAQSLRSFLAHQALENDRREQQHLLLKSLADREDYGLFQHEARAFTDMLESDTNRGLDYHWYMAKLFHEMYFHQATGHGHAGQPLFRGAVEHLEKCFSLLMFFYETEAETRRRTLNEDERSVFMEGIRERLAQRFGPDEMPASLFLNLVEPGSRALQELFGALLDNDHLMSHFEFGMAWKILFVHAIMLSNQHDEQDLHELIFRMYRTGIEKQLIRGSELSDPIRFANIALAANLVGEYAWSADFIKANKKHLDDDVQESIVDFCLAHLHYHRGLQTQNPTDLGQALRLISRLEQMDETFEFRIRTLHLRIMYDCLAHDPDIGHTLLDSTRNFKKFLARNRKLSKEKVLSFELFAHHFQKLVKLTMATPKPAEAIASFIKTLETEKGAAFIKWMMERAGKLGEALG